MLKAKMDRTEMREKSPQSQFKMLTLGYVVTRTSRKKSLEGRE